MKLLSYLFKCNFTKPVWELFVTPFWGQIAGMGIATLGASQQKKGGKAEMKTIEPREYEEANKARAEWYDKLMQFGGEESFGAIGPNWDEIWEQARNKVRGYWGGTATTTGAIDKIKAESAKRNIAGGPAMAKNILRAQAAEAGQIKDIGVQQNLAKANFRESGRMNWMQSLQNLASQRAPQSIPYTENTPADNTQANALMGFGGGVANYFGAKDYRSWLEGVMKTGNKGKKNTSPSMAGLSTGGAY